MTTHTTTGLPLTQRAAGHHSDHTITGTAAQLRAVISQHRDAGTLAAMTTPHRIAPGRYQMAIRLRHTRPTVRTAVGGSTRVTAHHTGRARRGTRIAVVATAITGTLAGLVATAAYLIGQLVELITAHAGQILGVLVLAAILAGLTARSSSGRRHCPGC